MWFYVSKRFTPLKSADITWNGTQPYSNDYKDIYYPECSGIEQSQYVFIEGNDLINRWQFLPQDMQSHFNIGEIGFGTGLNFLLTWHLWEQHAPQSANLFFISCDKHPLKKSDLEHALTQWPLLESKAKALINQYPILTPGMHQLRFNNGRVTLLLMLGDACESFGQQLICGDSVLEPTLRSAFIDAWYLDGFTPKKNMELWSEDLIKVISLLSKNGTSLATYTVAARVKSLLAKYGFKITKKKGYGCKRHMLTSTFEQPREPMRHQRTTPWHSCLHHNVNEKNALIIGAGLSGCFTAYALAKRGWSITLIEEEHAIAQKGSANQQAVLFPKLSAFGSPFTEFMLLAFLHAHSIYSKILEQFNCGELNGILALAYNDKEAKSQAELKDYISCYPELGQLVDANQATNISGIELDNPGLFIPHSGWMDTQALCRHLLLSPQINLILGSRVSAINYESSSWEVNGYKAPILILANSYQLTEFQETSYLPIKPIRGQMTLIASTQQSQQLKIPVCAEGHVLPAVNGLHHLGATYDLGVATPNISIEDNQLNLDKLKQISPKTNWSHLIQGQWSGIRATTPDYLPMLGQVAKADEFLLDYKALNSNAKRWLPKTGPYYQGLYVCAGFGSRGLTTIPLAAEWLAGLLSNEFSILPRHLIQALSPARFLRKKIIRAHIR